MMPKGITLNNPMNLEHSAANAWRGLSTCQPDPVFVSFDKIEDGLRAGMLDVRNYQRLRNLTTIRQIITRYAPPVENNTAAYIADVCTRCRANPDDDFDIEIPTNLILLAKAIVRHEQGACPDPTLPYWYDDGIYAAAAKDALT